MQRWVWALAVVLGFAGTGAAQDRWLVRQKNPSPEGRWTLFDDGSVTRGDPAIDYDQRENCEHGKSANCNGQLNLTGWRIAAQGGSNHTDNFFVTFTKGNPSYDTGFESAQVYYNLRAGGVVTKAVKTASYQTTEQAKLDQIIRQGNFSLSYTTRPATDGSRQSIYRNAEGGQIAVFSNGSGALRAALVDERQQLAADQVSVQPYYDLPLPSCLTVYCSGFDDKGNITKMPVVR